jgi:ATP-dependent protease Clp ATPase subunit
MRSSTYCRMEKANLFVSGLPGVGKTLTAEGLAEHLERPLYIVCHILMMLLFMLTFVGIGWGSRQ